MQKYIECTGKTEDAAIAAALDQLGLAREDVSVEVLELAKPGFLGIGACGGGDPRGGGGAGGKADRKDRDRRHRRQR